jgi:hypothetical protein
VISVKSSCSINIDMSTRPPGTIVCDHASGLIGLLVFASKSLKKSSSTHDEPGVLLNDSSKKTLKTYSPMSGMMINTVRMVLCLVAAEGFIIKNTRRSAESIIKRYVVFGEKLRRQCSCRANSPGESKT